MHLFWKRGYTATGIAELTDTLGVGRQTIYSAFGDKRRLFEQAVEHYMDTVIEQKVLSALRETTPAIEGFARVFDAWEEAAADPSFPGCLVANSAGELGARDSVVNRRLRREFERIESAFASAIRRARGEGDVRPDVDEVVLARQLLVIGQGVALLAKVRRDAAWVRDAVGAARALVASIRLNVPKLEA